MLSLLKKTSSKSSAKTMPAWHPNFRNFERLPDAKAVRRLAFLNVAAIACVLVLGVYVGYREYKLNQLRREADQIASQIEVQKPGSDKAIALYKQFKEEERKLHELRDFAAASPIVASEFILDVGESRPAGIGFTSISCDTSGALLLGSSSGAPDEAAERARAYVEALKQNPKFKRFESITLNIVRDPGSGGMRFEITMKLNVAPPKPTGRRR